jgi:AcrR family transcriptional regulator
MKATDRVLTPKGRATRERIVEAAAKLIYQRGVHGTNNELVRRAAGVSGSQLGHYFPDKESLVRAVIAWRADRVVTAHRIPELGGLDTFAALHLWADSWIEREEVCRGGCSFGSLASEIIKSDLDVHGELADGFDRWEDLFREGLHAMRSHGDIAPSANPDDLAHLLMAAFQGGMLLTQAARDVAPLKAALTGAIAYVETFAAR